MRVVRDLRFVLRIRRRRGYFRTPIRPARRRPAGLQRHCTAGGILAAPRGARSFALNLVRSEMLAGTYVTPARLSAALNRLLATAL
jgi:hypothetical protein